MKKNIQTKPTTSQNHPLSLVSIHKSIECLYRIVYDLMCVNISKTFISITLLDIVQSSTHIKSEKRRSDEIMSHQKPKRQKCTQNSLVKIGIATPNHERKI